MVPRGPRGLGSCGPLPGPGLLEQPVPTRWVLLGIALSGWVVVPLALYAANARDRNGPVPPLRALATLVRHPLAVLATILILPLGLCLVEAASATVAATERLLMPMVETLYPLPRLVYRGGWPARSFSLTTSLGSRLWTGRMTTASGSTGPACGGAST